MVNKVHHVPSRCRRSPHLSDGIVCHLSTPDVVSGKIYSAREGSKPYHEVQIHL